jgi:hypothetical protein
VDLVLCLDIDPFLYLYNTYHEDRHEGSLSNEAMNEHCAVYYVLNEAAKQKLINLLFMKIYWIMNGYWCLHVWD